MVTPNFDYYFSLGESARMRNEPRDCSHLFGLSEKGFNKVLSETWLKGWDFRDAVLKGDKQENQKPSSYP